MKFARLMLVLLAIFAMAFPALSAPTRRAGKDKEPMEVRGGGSMTPARQSAERPGGNQNKEAGYYSYWCYADPNTTWGCIGTSGTCHSECERTCGGECTWCDAEM